MPWSRPSGKACWDRRPMRPHRRHRPPCPTACMWFLPDQPTRAVGDARRCRQRGQNEASRPRPSPPPSPRHRATSGAATTCDTHPRLRGEHVRAAARRAAGPVPVRPAPSQRCRLARLLRARRQRPTVAEPSRPRGRRSECPGHRYARRARQPGRWPHRSCAWPDPGCTHTHRLRCSRSTLPTCAHRPRATAARKRLARSPRGALEFVGRRGVAQHGSALDWGSRGRWFKSSRPDHISERETAL